MVNYYWFQCDEKMTGYNKEAWVWDLKDENDKDRKHESVFKEIKQDDEVVCYITGKKVIFGIFTVVNKDDDSVTLRLKEELGIKCDEELYEKLFSSTRNIVRVTYSKLTPEQMNIILENHKKV